MSSTNPGAAVTTTLNTQPPQANLAKIQTLSINVGTVAAVGAATTSEIAFSGLGTGLLVGDVILGINKPATQAGLGIAGFRVSSTTPDTFYITYVNATAGSLTPTASEVYQVTIARPVTGSSTSAVI